MANSTVRGTWMDVARGIRHLATGELLGVSSPDRWRTRTPCGMLLYVCPNADTGNVVTCIRCLAVSAVKRTVSLQGQRADMVMYDEAQFFDVSHTFPPAKPSGSY